MSAEPGPGPGRPPKTAELLAAVGASATTVEVARRLGVTVATAGLRLHRAAARGELVKRPGRPLLWAPHSSSA